MAKNDRFSTSVHTGIASGIVGTPVAGLLTGLQHKLGAKLLDDENDRSLGGYVKKSALGAGLTGAIAGGALGPTLMKLAAQNGVKNIPKNVLLQILGGSVAGVGSAALGGSLAGVLGKLSDKVTE